MQLMLLLGLPIAILGLATYGLLRAFRPDDTREASYAPLVLAAPLLALAFYVFFRWKLSYGEGAASSIVIVPVIVYMVGAFAALAGLGLLYRFFEAGPGRPYLAVLAFLPCVAVALHPDMAQRLAADKQPSARTLAERQREEGIRDARTYHYYSPTQCPSRGAAYVEACQQAVKAAPRLPQYDTLWGQDWAQRGRLQNLKDCSDASRPGYDDDPSFTKGCLTAVREAQRLAIMRWALQHPDARVGDCTAAMGTLDSPDLGSLCRDILPKARESIGYDWVSRNVIFDGLECQMHWGKSTNAQDYLAGCLQHHPIWNHVDEARLVTDQVRFENLADCPHAEAVAPDAASIGCRYRADGGAAARIRQGREWGVQNHVSDRATCIDHFAEGEFAIDYVHGCLVAAQGVSHG